MMKDIWPLSKLLMSIRALVYFITFGIYSLNNLQGVATSDTFNSSDLTPKLMIFHLDKVIWKFSIDDVDKEVRINITGNIVTDKSGKILQVHSQAKDILKSLFDQRIKLGAISICPNTELVDRLMYLLKLDKVIIFQEFNYGMKVNHIEKIKRLCEIPYNEIVYFDYTTDGFISIEDRGMIAIKVKEDIGLTQDDINRGIRAYRENLDSYKRFVF